MTLITLQTLWFILIVVLFAGYAILDGFDLGVGVLHLFAKSEEERRVNINAIGPVWDGNEVWLIAAGGALFAAFAPVYAAIWSGFYPALILLLVALIARAVAFDFRAKVQHPSMKRFFDYCFGIGSLVIALLLGVAFGNVMHGVPIDENGWYVGTFFGLLNPFALLMGILTVVLFTMHGALYLILKTDGDRQQQLVKLAPQIWGAVVFLYAAGTLVAFYVTPGLQSLYFPVYERPVWYAMLAVTVGGLAGIPYYLGRKKFQASFLASAMATAGMLGLCSVGMYPRLVLSSISSANDLTAFTHSSTAYTLQIMLYIALAGMPFAILYKVILYRAFRGKTVLTKDSY
jgi:cytochrome bd ubiquinol oxidase subunit II